MLLITATNRKWWVLAAMTIMMATLNLDVTAVNLAVAPIAKSLQMSLAAAQWIINGFVITCAIFTTIAGKFGDMFGHRRVFLTGALILLIASIWATAAHHQDSIILARILQGMGVAISFPMIYTINFNVFPASQRGYALGIMTAGIGFAQAIGPTLGGVILETLGWRWIFFINVPIALTASLLILITYSDKRPQIKQYSIDFLGILLLIAGFFSLIVSLNRAYAWGLTSRLFLSSMSLAVIILTIFIFWELRAKAPILDVKLLKIRSFALVNVIRMIYSYVFFTSLFLIGILLINILNYSPSQAGLLMLFMTGAFSLTSLISGKGIDMIGTKIPLTVGMSILTISFVLLALLTLKFNLTQFIISLLAIGIASGILLPSTAIAAISIVNKEQRGSATGIFYSNMFLGAAIGVAISGCMLNLISAKHLIKLSVAQGINLKGFPSRIINDIATGLRSTGQLSHYLSPDLASQIKELAHLTFMRAFASIMWLCAAFCFIGIILSLFTVSMRNRNE